LKELRNASEPRLIGWYHNFSEAPYIVDALVSLKKAGPKTFDPAFNQSGENELE
jgi:hypothetical protein